MLGKKNGNSAKAGDQQETNTNKVSISTFKKDLDENIALIRKVFKDDETLIVRKFNNKWLKKATCCILYFDGMVKIEVLNEGVLQPILRNDLAKEIDGNNLLEELKSKVISAHGVNVESDLNKICDSMILGDTILLVDGYDKALVISSKGWQSRSISEPESAKVVRGPREGFTESISVNITLLRRRIRNPDLKFKFMELGERTRTKICVSYIEGLALDEIIQELYRRLNDIKIDAILDSGYVQELIRDAPLSPFDTVGQSERPDVIAAKLLEGRIAVFVDGSPFVLTVPFVIVEYAQSNEDYYNNYIFASINRLIRATATVFSVSIPAIYLAIVTYHQEMLPTPLLLSISASRQGVPIPTSVSLFAMLLVFDILREAGARMPTTIGQAINIVGTLVLGQAAVEAKLVSAPVIIITALSGITALLNVNMLGATIIVRTFLLLAASVLGIYGYIFGIILVILLLLSMRSFGVPFLLNLTSVSNHNGQDIWIRAPWWTMTLRPKIIAARNLVRQTTRKNGGKQ